MKTIGLIGGMTWHSTIPYYRIINEAVAARSGGLHSAKLVLYSVDFFDLERMMRAGDWDGIGRTLAAAARAIEAAGAEVVVLCTNTVHKAAGTIEAAVSIPLLHIVDATAAAVKAAGMTKVGLLGTRFTMEQDFYRARLWERHGIAVIVPPSPDREIVHRVIFEELGLGKTLDASRNEYRRIIADLATAGAQGVILGCTEIAMLVGPADSPIPIFDTTEIHAQAAVAAAFGDGG